MDANTTKTRARLRQIVALLAALACLAERAACRSGPAAWLALWVLRRGEAVAHDHVLSLTGHVACAPAPGDLSQVANEALRLAARFRALAMALSAFVAAMAGMRVVDRAPRAVTRPAAAPAPRASGHRAIERRDSS